MSLQPVWMRTAFALALMCCGQVAVAGKNLTEVKAVRYPAWIEQGTQIVPVQPGTQLRPGDVLASGDDARVLMVMPDGSEMKLGQKARFSITHLESTEVPGGTHIEAALNLMAGRFRYATTALSKLTGKRSMELKVSTATIGIRGTDFWALTDNERDAVCLFEGKVDVLTQEQEVVTLDKPTAFWNRYFDKPAQAAGNASAEELVQFLGWVEIAPGTGVAVNNGRWRLLAGNEKTAAQAHALATVLRTKGYPAVVVRNYGLYEVRLNQLATRADASALQKKLEAQSGLLGTDPKIVVTR